MYNVQERIHQFCLLQFVTQHIFSASCDQLAARIANLTEKTEEQEEQLRRLSVLKAFQDARLTEFREIKLLYTRKNNN